MRTSRVSPPDIVSVSAGWHAERTVGLTEVTRGLDLRNFERVLEALRLCRSLPFAERTPLAAWREECEGGLLLRPSPSR